MTEPAAGSAVVGVATPVLRWPLAAQKHEKGHSREEVGRIDA